MNPAAERVTLDDDVLEALQRLAARSGRPIDVLANAVLRDYLRCENEEVLEIIRRVREALASKGGLSREESIARARSAIEGARSRKAWRRWD